MEDVIDTRLICQPTKEGRAQTTQTEHQAKEHARYHARLVRHEVCGIHHDAGECRSNDKAGQEGACQRQGQVHIGHKHGKRSRTEYGEPYHVLTAKTVAEESAGYRAYRIGCQEHEETQLRRLHAHPELVDEEEREITRDTRRVEILREHQEYQYQ